VERLGIINSIVWRILDPRQVNGQTELILGVEQAGKRIQSRLQARCHPLCIVACKVDVGIGVHHQIGAKQSRVPPNSEPDGTTLLHLATRGVVMADLEMVRHWAPGVLKH
jgi:hypothetical protein